MRLETQYSIFMVNKPGVLAQVLGEFAHAKINIVALTMVDTVEHGVMRLVATPGAKVKKMLAIKRPVDLAAEGFPPDSPN